MKSTNEEKFTISNIVSDVTLSSEINLEYLFQHVKITPVVLKPKHMTKTKDGTLVPPKQIPYFDEGEKICISFRYKKRSKGYRPELKKTSAFADGDIQFNKKNYHFKISKKKINLLGVKEYSLLTKIYDVILEIINNAERERKTGLPIFTGEETLTYLNLKINNVLVNGAFFLNDEEKYSLNDISKKLKDKISSDNVLVEFDNSNKKEITIKFLNDEKQSLGKCILKANGKTTFTLKLEEEELKNLIGFLYTQVNSVLHDVDN